MSFIKEFAESFNAVVPKEGEAVEVEVKPEVPEQDTQPSGETPEETQSEEPTEVTPAQTEPESVDETPVEAPVFDKKAWLEEHKDALFNYYQEVGRDYDKMSPEDLVKRKLKEDNPSWSESDIEHELREEYFVGQQEIVIDRDEMDDDEIKEAERFNKELAKAQRRLKSAAANAKTVFEERKSAIEAPDIKLPELDFKAENERLQKEYEAELAKQKEKWNKLVEEGVTPVTTVKKTISFEDNGSPVEITVDYKLSDKQKQDLSGYLQEYVYNPAEDQRYLQEDGTVDMASFVRDKAEKVYFDNILKSALIEYGAHVRKNVLKDKVNFDDEPKSRPPSGDPTSLTEAAEALWKRRGRNANRS